MDRSNGDVAIDHTIIIDVEVMKDMNMDAYRFSILLVPNIAKYELETNDYAELCFKEFGDRVKHWITLNEPWTITTEPYIVAHNQLLAHAAAVNVYKTKYQVYGAINNRRLPKFHAVFGGKSIAKVLKKQSMLVKGSFDFIGLNYYTSYYATDAPELSEARPSFLTDSLVILTNERDGKPIDPTTSSKRQYVYPKGICELLLYIKTKYNNPLIYITENGIKELNDPTLSLEEALADTHRIDYHYDHLYYLQKAIKDGVNVKGYFAWSLMDNYEWLLGYTVRYGINYVDYKMTSKDIQNCRPSGLGISYNTK
ncbi:Glycoside hydrolase family 1 [Sesbania bispinosa]|nr:Glycoside hydrolase family 1 [Sesbania bispinosa]